MPGYASTYCRLSDLLTREVLPDFMGLTFPVAFDGADRPMIYDSDGHAMRLDGSNIQGNHWFITDNFPFNSYLPVDAVDPNLGLASDPTVYVQLSKGLSASVCNGNIVQGVPLFTSRGRGFSGDFSLTYNSLGIEPGSLSKGWTHSYDWLLTVYGSVNQGVLTPWEYEVRFPDGRTVRYRFVTYGGTLFRPSPYYYSGSYGESSHIDISSGNPILILKDGTKITFNDRGRPAQIVDTQIVPNILILEYGDNPGSNLAELEFPGQSEFLLTRVTDSVGRQTEFRYDSQNRLYEVENAPGDICRFTCDTTGRLTEILCLPVQSLPHTVQWKFEYWDVSDPVTGAYRDLLRSVMSPRAVVGNYKTDMFYTPDRTVWCVKLPPDAYVNEQGNLIQMNPTWSFEYDHPDFNAAPGAVPKTLVTNPRGNVTTYEYQYRRSIVTKKSYPDGFFEEWTYDNNPYLPDGYTPNPDFHRSPQAYRGRGGNSTTYTYYLPPNPPSATQPFAVARVQTILRPGNVTPTSYAYGVFNRLQTVTDPLGNQTVYALDPGTGNVTSITHPATPTVLSDGSIVTQSATETFTYLPDGSGRIDTHTSPAGGITDYNYGGPNDPFNTGLPTEVIRPGHALPAQTKYDLLGNVTGTAPPGRPFTDLILDGLYRIKERREPQVGSFTSITKYTYDEDSNLLTVEDPRNNVTTYTYDRQGRRKTVTQPAPFSATSTTDYDVNGNVRKIVDFKGNASTFTYDPLNRPLTQVLPGTPNRVTYFGEDTGGGGIANGYDANGNLVLMTEVGDVSNPDRVTRHRYDVRNNRTHTVRVDNQGIKHFAERSQYDQNDRLTQSLLFEGVDPVLGTGGTFRSGNGYTYDARNRRQTLRQATAVSTGDLIVGSLDTQHRYDANSNLRFTEDPLSVRSWTVFDASDRPVQQLADDLRILRHTTYTEDDLVDEVWTPKPSLAGPVFTFNTVDFTRVAKNDYDDQQRLFRTTDADGYFTTTGYDGADNVLVATDRRGFTKEWLSYDALNRPGTLREQLDVGSYVQTVYTYDNNSNMETLLDPNTGLHTFTYDGGNRLQKLEYPPMTGGRRSEEWTYTPHGERYEHKWNSLTGSLSQKQTMTYDAFGRPTRDLAQTGSGMTLNDVQRLWDAAGNLLKTEDVTTGAKTVYGIESGGDVTGGYDALNRPVLSQYFQGGMLLKAVSTAWDNASRRDTVLGTDGDRTRYAYDANGLMQNLYFQLPSGGELLQETQTYDAGLRHKTTQDMIASLVTTRTYDNRELLGQIETKKTAGTPISNIVYTRDPEGNLQTKTTVASGETNAVAYLHDGLGRILHEQWAGTVPYAASYGYDANGNRTAKKVIALTGKSVQGTGTLRKIVPAFEIVTSLPMFDEENRLTDSLVTKTSYSTLTPTGTTVSSTAPGFAQGALVDGATPNTYDPTKTWASLDQSGTHTACLDLGSVTSVGQVKCWLPTTHGLFQRFKVTYWNGSGYSDIPAEGVFGAVAVSGGWYRNTQHEVTFNCFSVSTDKICFEMDSGGGAPGRPNQAALNELQAFKPVTTVQHAYTNIYDDAGNRIVRNDSTTGITETHSYDGFNRYVGYDRSGSNPTSVDYLLTPEGDRLARLTSTGNTWFINDGSDVLSDYTGSPGSLSPSLFYVNGLGIDDKRIRYTLGGTRHTYNTDHLGTPIQILDTSAKPAKSLRLNAWGEEVPKGGVLHVQPVPYPGGTAFSDRHHFTQRERMPESGLMYYRNRLYSPDEGVFIQKDPHLGNRVVETYQYARNRTLSMRDPQGDDPVSIAIAVGAYFGWKALESGVETGVEAGVAKATGDTKFNPLLTFGKNFVVNSTVGIVPGVTEAKIGTKMLIGSGKFALRSAGDAAVDQAARGGTFSENLLVSGIGNLGGDALGALVRKGAILVTDSKTGTVRAFLADETGAVTVLDVDPATGKGIVRGIANPVPEDLAFARALTPVQVAQIKAGENPLLSRFPGSREAFVTSSRELPANFSRKQIANLLAIGEENVGGILRFRLKDPTGLASPIRRNIPGFVGGGRTGGGLPEFVIPNRSVRDLEFVLEEIR